MGDVPKAPRFYIVPSLSHHTDMATQLLVQRVLAVDELVLGEARPQWTELLELCRQLVRYVVERDAFAMSVQETAVQLLAGGHDLEDPEFLGMIGVDLGVVETEKAAKHKKGPKPRKAKATLLELVSEED